MPSCGCDWVPSNCRNTVILFLLLWLNGIGCMISNRKGEAQMNDIHWGNKTEDLAIFLSAAKEEYKLNEPIELVISLKNFGTQPIPVVIRSPWIDYALNIRYESGADVRKTAYGFRMIESAVEGRRATRQLMPGETITEGLELSKGYDMKSPSAYKIVARRETYKKGRNDQYATVTSNELVIKIIE